MAIVLTEIESIHGAPTEQRMIFFRCQDSQGVWHSYGPVITIDPAFDVEGHKAIVAVKMTESLAASEFEQVIS